MCASPAPPPAAADNAAPTKHTPSLSGGCGAAPAAVAEADELAALVSTAAAARGAAAVDAVEPRFGQIVDRYQAAPHLLDAHLPSTLPALAAALLAASSARDPALAAAVGRLLWRAVSARGRKAAAKFFPAAVDDFEPVVLLLAGITGVGVPGGEEDDTSSAHTETGAALATDPLAWPARTALFVWLAHVATLPFPLRLLDGRQAVADAEDNFHDPAWPPLAAAAAAAARATLPAPGPDRDAAAAALAALLARPDAAHRLPREVAACAPALAAPATGGPADTAALGAASAVAALFGRAPPPAAAAAAPAAWDALAPLLESGGHGVATRRAGVKAATRVALALLDGGGDATPRLHGQAATTTTTRTNAAAALIVSTLRDRDTAVRWAAAKGVAKLAAALAARGAPQSAAALRRGATALLAASESDAAWHGGCLALAGLLRAGCVPPDEYEGAAAAAAAALVFDVRRGAASVGAHVRDAGAYVAWALARCRPRAAAAAALGPLGPTLLAAACSDRDVNCRRAAAAAFQEAVGRAAAFPAGLAATAAADFYALATRRGAYCAAAPAVAALHKTYAAALVDAFVKKTTHWDRATRDAAADALAGVTGVAPDLASSAATALLAGAAAADGDARHGGVAALAALVRARRPLGPASTAVAAIPLTWRALVRGRGGEAVRHALMALVAAVADHGGIDLPPAAAAAAAAAADDCVRHPAAPVRDAAAAALGALARRSDGGGVPVDAGRVYAAAVAAGHAAAATTPPEPRRGAAAALGALPPGLLVPFIDDVVAALCTGCCLEPAVSGRDAEARAAAAAALAAVAASAAPALPADAAADLRVRVINALLPACADYATDRRGDVGAWVRAPAASGLAATLVAGAADARVAALAPAAVAALVRLACERSAKLRDIGRDGLARVLAAVDGVPQREAVVAALEATNPPSSLTCDDAALALAARLAAVAPPIAPAALAGLAACAGGLDGPLALAAERALATAVATAGGDALTTWLADAWDAALAPPRDARLLTPLLRAADVVGSTDSGAAALAGCPVLAARLVTLTLTTARGSRDPARLRTAAGALAALAGAGAHAAATRALRSLVLLTGHAFPATRRAAAEALAVRLVLGVDCCAAGADVDGAGDLVAATAWCGDVGAARAARAQLCVSLGLDPPAEAAEGAAEDNAVARPPQPGGDGYAALVTAAERGG